MKKSVFGLLAVVLAGSASIASAATFGDLDVATQASASSAYNFRGISMSDKDPSLGLKVQATHASGVYGSVSADSVKLTPTLGGGLNQYHGQFTMGYDHSFGPGVKTGLGLTRHAFMGKGGVNDASFSEVFVRAEAYGFEGMLATTIEGSRAGFAGSGKGDVYGQIGYTHHFGKFNVGGDLGYAWYDNKYDGLKSSTSTLAQLRAGYAVSNDFRVDLVHQFGDSFGGGKGFSGNNTTYVKASYSF